MSEGEIALCFAVMFIVTAAFLLIRMTMADQREAVKKRQALIDAAARNPAPGGLLELGKLTLEDGDFNKALGYFVQSAGLGSAEAAWRAANIHLDKGDLPAYFEFMLKSAELGDQWAMIRVASAYKEGKGTLKNIGRHTHWLLRSAEAGNAESMTQVALAYVEGYGVVENPMEGLAWLYVAEFKRNTSAVELIKTAESKLNNSLILMAQDRAKVIIDLIKEGRRTSDSSLSGSLPSFKPGQPAPSKPKHEAKGSGSGAIVSASGHVVTAAHVIKGATYLEIVTPAGTHPATVLSVDDANDVALLKVDQPFDAHIAVGRSSDVRLGQSVATIGFPNIGIQGHSPKVTQGMISGENGVQNDIRMWQISVPIQPGNSGGPLLDEQGRLVGVVVASLSLRAIQITGSVPQNVNYAIKGAYLEPLLNFHKVLLAPAVTGTPASFQDMIAAAQKASVLILVY
jgi:S1-C subfamily serine protease